MGGKYHILPYIMRTRVFVCIIHRFIIPIVMPTVCNHYTRVHRASLIFPQKFGQKSMHSTQQNMIITSIFMITSVFQFIGLLHFFYELFIPVFCPFGKMRVVLSLCTTSVHISDINPFACEVYCNYFLSFVF